MSTGRLGAGDTAIQPTILNAKADLLTATAADTPARLAVGNDGETLVADSSATTGLRWQGDYAAGKNKIINGDFNINQRALLALLLVVMVLTDLVTFLLVAQLLIPANHLL
jgi:hypothetical protein